MHPIQQSGLYHDITAEQYHADPAPAPSVSRGAIVDLVTKSPLHCYLGHPRLGAKPAEDDPTAKMDFGSLGHRMLLGKGADIEVGEWDDWKTNAAKDFRKAVRAAKKIPCLQGVYERAVALDEAVRTDLARLGMREMFEAAQSEVVAVWQEDGEFLRAMYDKLWFDAPKPEEATRAVVFDLKITESANPEACEKQINNMAYDVQSFHYQRGLTKLLPNLAGRTEFIFLFAESTFPFCVTPMDLNGEFEVLGKRTWEKGFLKWKECRTANRWPAYADGVMHAHPPGWRMAQELKREFA